MGYRIRMDVKRLQAGGQVAARWVNAALGSAQSGGRGMVGCRHTGVMNMSNGLHMLNCDAGWGG